MKRKTFQLLVWVLCFSQLELFANCDKRAYKFCDTQGIGLFATFTGAVVFLNEYEEGRFTGLEVDFGDLGLYYDAQAGLNWWSYYFEPINVGDISEPKAYLVDGTCFCTGKISKSITRERANFLINKYI